MWRVWAHFLSQQNDRDSWGACGSLRFAEMGHEPHMGMSPHLESLCPSVSEDKWDLRYLFVNQLLLTLSTVSAFPHFLNPTKPVLTLKGQRVT